MMRNDNGQCSPVVAVIVMVAITVILAAILAAFVFGLASWSDEHEQNLTVSAIYDQRDGGISHFYLVTNNGTFETRGSLIDVIPLNKEECYRVSNTTKRIIGFCDEKKEFPIHCIAGDCMTGVK